MKYYDFKKAINLIENSKDFLQSASLGMHEDWFWTAQTIWEGGEFKTELAENATDLEAAFIEARKNGLSMFLEEKDENGLVKFNPMYNEMTKHRIGGLFGSDWATPTLQLIYQDGEDKMIPCFLGDGEEISLGEKIQKQIECTSGVLSSEVQENITPLSAY